MPHEVDIEIFNIARTTVDPVEVNNWLSRIGVSEEFEVPDWRSITDPALVIAFAAKRCYMSFEAGLNPNVTQVRKSYVDYFDNILKSGHGSMLEHAVFSYAIEGISRVFTGEMNRHRAGWAISEGSMRFIRYTDIPYWMPTSFATRDGDSPELFNRKIRSQNIIWRAFRQAEDNYAELNDVWDMDEGHKDFHYKKIVTSANRRVIPMGVATGGVWTGNVRALRHVMALRTSEAAEEEIAYVFGKIGADIVQREPMLFGDFTFTGKSWIPVNSKV